MSRPLRLEFPGAVYHVTSRGDRREAIYRDDADRACQLAVLAQAAERFEVQVLAYCLMGNHFHIVLHTQRANLSRFMRHLNGVYTQAFNRRHGLVGHLFQGRFKAILVDRDSYLLALCRYVERNPVAAKLVKRAEQWPWSSCQAHLGVVPSPPWLDTDGLYGYLLARAAASARDRERAQALYRAHIEQEPTGQPTIWEAGLRGQVYLGDEVFAERMRAQASGAQRLAKSIPKAQRLAPKTWAQWLAACEGERDRALHAAYREGGMTMLALAVDAGLSKTHVSRLIAREEAAGR
jgi:putative transposase